jgi:phosphohistidine phosphatase SixA
MLSSDLIADVCLSSTALRCIQTAERVLTGKSEYQLLFFLNIITYFFV